MTRQSDETVRRILCVFPALCAFLRHVRARLPATDGVRAFMPPQGLLVIAAYLPESWEVRFVDENIAPATREDFAWADAVFVSGMHIQRRRSTRSAAAPMRPARPAVLGGPSVSAARRTIRISIICMSANWATRPMQLIALALQAGSVAAASQIASHDRERRPSPSFRCRPTSSRKFARYFIGSVQFSSGCPYQCEFCDIPALYGRNPRMKTPEQIIAELDRCSPAELGGSVYFVDDNFIGNRQALRASSCRI